MPLSNNIYDINKISINDAFTFAEDFGLVISNQIIDENDLIQELQGQLGNININIPIDGEDKVLTTIPNSKFIVKKIKSEIETISYPQNDNSVLENYNNYKKLSRYIAEYIYWLYSKYIFEENIKQEEILNSKNLLNFKNKYILLQEDFQYQQINKTFSMNSGIMKDNKIVIKSEETLKRIFYVLKLYFEFDS